MKFIENKTAGAVSLTNYVYDEMATSAKLKEHVLLTQQPYLIQHNRALIAILGQLQSVVDRLTPFEFGVLNSCYLSVENGLLGTGAPATSPGRPSA